MAKETACEITVSSPFGKQCKGQCRKTCQYVFLLLRILFTAVTLQSIEKVLAYGAGQWKVLIVMHFQLIKLKVFND